MADPPPSEGEAAAGEGKPATELPHYAKPSLAHVLPEYRNAEQDYIRAAFRAGTFTSISGLPTHLREEELIRAREERRAALRRRGDAVVGGTGAPAWKGLKNGLFQEFAYEPSRYSLYDELASKERLESDAKRLEVGGKPFLVGGGGRRLKHESAFGEKDYRYAYLDDPYIEAKDTSARGKWLEDSKLLAGPFLPGGADSSIGRPTRAMLRDMLDKLASILSEDWSDHRFSILSGESDSSIIIRFDEETVESEKGLRAYMNAMARTDETVSSFRLRRVVEEWATKPGDGFLYFVFRPPWVRLNPTSAFYTLHPEERGALIDSAGDDKMEDERDALDLVADES